MYEDFRGEVLLKMSSSGMTTEEIKKAIEIVDSISAGYTFSKQTRELMVIGKEKLKEYCNIYLIVKKIEGCTDATIKNLEYALNPFVEYVNCPIEQIDTNLIRKYLALYKLNHNIKERSLDKLRERIKTWFVWMQNEGYITKNPTANVAAIKYNVKKKPALTQTELEKLRDVCRNDQERCLVEVLYSTGCRISEACNIKIKDIHFEKELPDCDILGKGGKWGKVYFSPRAVSMIHKYIESRPHESEWLFNNYRGGGQLSPSNVDKKFRELRELAGLENKKLTPHTMRHTTATTAIKVAPVEVVKELMRHSSIDTTMIYADVSPEEAKRYHERAII